VAISNHRITKVDGHNVSFTYKDYRNGSKQGELNLSHAEFIRRFAMHILPRGFVRIRHYGILSSTAKIKSLPQIKAQIPHEMQPAPPDQRQAEPYQKGICPHCKTATMVTIEIMPSRGPPRLIDNSRKFENECKN
jgi:hypothetical protein